MPPLEPQNIEVVLEGLDQKADRKTQAPGKLRYAYNVEFDKAGSLNKRRGFERLDTESELDGNTVEQVFMGVATFQGELLVIGSEYLYAVADIDSNTGAGSAGTGEDMILRGPVMRGSYRVQYVVSSPIGDTG